MMSKASSHETGELAVLVVFAVGLAHHRPGQPILAGHNLGEEIAFDAVEAAIDLRFGILCVATTRFFAVATMTLQPVPQNRHGALSHFSSLWVRSVVRLAALAGTDMPPARAAMAAASSLRT